MSIHTLYGAYNTFSQKAHCQRPQPEYLGIPRTQFRLTDDFCDAEAFPLPYHDDPDLEEPEDIEYSEDAWASKHQINLSSPYQLLTFSHFQC